VLRSLAKGTVVEVEATSYEAADRRIRGKIRDGGWFSIVDTSTSEYSWVKPQVQTISFKGLAEGDAQHSKMGVFELVKGEEANGRAVWQKAGEDIFIHYGSKNSWLVATRKNMEEEGTNNGWMSLKSAALTPDEATETWKAYDGSAWVEVPKVKARNCTAAMAAAQKVQTISFKGLEEGDAQHSKMGVFERVKGEEANGRAVWQKAGEDTFIHYGSNNTWIVATGRKGMEEEGTNKGLMSLASAALTPDEATETWKAWDGSAFVEVPKVKARKSS
jgi:hypothetical protein